MQQSARAQLASQQMSLHHLHALTEVLGLRARIQPQDTAYVFLDDEKNERRVTFGELDLRARAIAATLQRAGLRGSNALMLYPTGLSFVEAFFGCLYAGVVAVPVHPGRGKKAISRLRAVLEDCAPGVVMGTSELVSAMEEGLQEGSGLRLLRTDGIDSAVASEFREEPISPDQVAFLQYTSGSTSRPKGVMVTHGNIMANQLMIQQSARTSASSVMVSWLPLFHDMGLIGNMMHAVYLGAPAIFLPTLTFVMNPISWLQAISKYKATASGAPNFAYELCVARTTPEQRASLDLSSWRTALNGAEPVRPETLAAFVEAFTPCGLRADVFMPCFGLAEATLLVSGGAERMPSRVSVNRRLLTANLVNEEWPGSGRAQSLVSCGPYLWGDQDLRIVDPSTLRECTSREVGEIWVSGSHVAAGYWRNEEATRETFQATLPKAPGRSFLRTGDLGFVKNGELFVTGRLKDVIVLQGQSHYPQDIERTAEDACPALHKGSSAAFSVQDDGSQGIVIVAEIERAAARRSDIFETLAAVARQTAEAHQLPIQRVVLVPGNSVPRTTSGKIQRRSCKAEYLAGRLKILGQWENPLAQAGPASGRLSQRR